jgi:hypothetical protein
LQKTPVSLSAQIKTLPSRRLKITLSRPLAGFPVRNFNRSIICSQTPQQAAGNALTIAVQRWAEAEGEGIFNQQ